MAILPTDVMVEILSHVPARSVGRFRTVSKLYYRLLSEPSFIKEHLRRHGSSVKLIVHMIMRLDFLQPKRTRTRYIYYPLDNNNLTSDTLASSEVNYSSYEIVGDGISVLASCNGLCCAIDDVKGVLMLWNPTTKEVNCLPQLKQDDKFDCFTKSYESTRCLYHYGFGYDQLNDDYKIVCVICVSTRQTRPATALFVGQAETPLTTATYIYSHRRGCWKEIEPFPPYILHFGYDNCQFVQGKVHWVAYSCRDEYGHINKESQFIISLDLATERYGTVPLPPTTNTGVRLNVCGLGGELCFYINSSTYNVSIGLGSGFEMWMMRDYGVEQSWFQLLTIPHHNLQGDDFYYCKICVPLFLMQSGEILFKVFEGSKISIYLYNPKTCDFITVNTVTDGRLYGHIYVESLVETTTPISCNKGQAFPDLA